MGDLVGRHDLIADDAQAPHGEDGPELVCAQCRSERPLSSPRSWVTSRLSCRRLHTVRHGADIGGMPPVEQSAQWSDANEDDQAIDIERMTPAEARDQPRVERVEDERAMRRPRTDEAHGRAA